jgi:hypothetical protein
VNQLISLSALAIVTFTWAAPGLEGQSTRPNFSGTWSLDASKCALKHSKAPEKQVVKIDAARDKITVADTLTEGGKEVSKSWECSTVGKECTYEDAGKAVKSSMFYSGPVLMEFRTVGDDVMRRSMKMSEDGKTLEVEITYITPQKDSEKFVFTKVETAESATTASAPKQ